MSLWTLVRINLQTAAEVRTFVNKSVKFLTSLWTLARINLQTAAEVRTFVKKYVNFLTSFWTGRRFSAILLNWVFVLYVFYHVLRNAPHPADRQRHGQLKASGLSLLASQFVWELKWLQRCTHLSKNMLTFSQVYEHWQETICKRPQRCKHLSKNMLTFSRVFEQVDDFLRYCWTKFSFYMCFTMFSEALRTPRTDRRTETRTIKGFRAQPPGKPVRMRIKSAA